MLKEKENMKKAREFCKERSEDVLEEYFLEWK